LLENVAIRKAETNAATMSVTANGSREARVFLCRVIGAPKLHLGHLLTLYPQWYLSTRSIHS
jgi:hypothetical protein